MIIRNFEDFVEELLAAGFSTGGGSNQVFALIPWGWEEQPPYETPVSWHTGDAQTDPWEWRMRILEECNDIAYGKLFFGKSGYITRQWYPYFIAARRPEGFDEAYASGTISRTAKRIYTVVQENTVLPLPAIKQLGGFSRDEKSAFDRALIELQMKLYLTMCGRQQKISHQNEEYGWASTVFCTTEHFFGDDVFEQAAQISQQQAIDAITDQVRRLNPDAQPKQIAKFIRG